MDDVSEPETEPGSRGGGWALMRGRGPRDRAPSKDELCKGRSSKPIERASGGPRSRT
jgi:hypothetical protein